MGRKLIPVDLKPCAFCGKVMERKQFGDRWEDRAVYGRRKYCGFLCMAKAMVKEKKSRGRWQMLARRFKKTTCENCGTTADLEIHHKNRVWSDNSPANLATLCSTCHMRLHHQNGDIPAPPAKTHCIHGHLKTGRTKSGRRVCRVCQKRWDSERSPKSRRKLSKP